MYIHICFGNASENIQLCIEISHQNVTFKNKLILLIYPRNYENIDLTSSNRLSTSYRKLFWCSETHDRAFWKIQRCRDISFFSDHAFIQ